MTDEIEYTTKTVRGRQDYQMENGEYTDRYKKLVSIGTIDEKAGLYYIIEKDRRKGEEFVLIDSIKRRISRGIKLR